MLTLLPLIPDLEQRQEARGRNTVLGKLIKIAEISGIRTRSCVTAAFIGVQSENDGRWHSSPSAHPSQLHT